MPLGADGHTTTPDGTAVAERPDPCRGAPDGEGAAAVLTGSYEVQGSV